MANRAKLFVTTIFMLFLTTTLWAQRVDTITIDSKILNKKLSAVVITSRYINDGKPRNVVYLLHGYGNDFRYWTQQNNICRQFVGRYDFIMVLPEGERGWYIDSPVDSTSHYESYFCKELIPLVDSLYPTVKDPSGRAITGLSMGGHGALSLAINNQNLFSIAGSMAGGVDFRPFPKNWNLVDILGDPKTHAENWEKFSVINKLSLIKPDSLSLIIDCGVDDFFYEANCNLHNKLMEMKIPHDFYSRPGAHNWDYWSNALKYQLLFINDRHSTLLTLEEIE